MKGINTEKIWQIWYIVNNDIKTVMNMPNDHNNEVISDNCPLVVGKLSILILKANVKMIY